MGGLRWRMSYSVTTINSVPRSRRRGIGFLECSDNGRVNAKRYFDKLREKTARDVRSRFDYWLRGGVFDKYFHGWPNDRYHKHCFVFKWKQAGAHHRLYGFLYNPMPSINPAFQVCILVSHAQKNTEETDPSELNVVDELRNRKEVVEAVRAAFPDDYE
jgi:hypothetical protein